MMSFSHSSKRHLGWTRPLNLAAVLMVTVVIMVSTLHAGTVTFGLSANQFQMEFVTIGNAGNTVKFSF